MEENWIIMEDFNTPLKENEKMGGSQTKLDNRLDLMDFIDNYLLHDMDLDGIDYTWTNRANRKDIIQVRLDRALICSNWFLKYK